MQIRYLGLLIFALLPNFSTLHKFLPFQNIITLNASLIPKFAKSLDFCWNWKYILSLMFSFTKHIFRCHFCYRYPSVSQSIKARGQCITTYENHRYEFWLLSGYTDLRRGKDPVMFGLPSVNMDFEKGKRRWYFTNCVCRGRQGFRTVPAF
jgi:hypothetical protein